MVVGRVVRQMILYIDVKIMIKASRNQLFNVYNNAQGKTKKVLTVCSAGLLRSATLANFLVKEYEYNVRNCGTVESYALIPISEALVCWADEIVFVNKENYRQVEEELKDILSEDGMKKIKVLDIPDNYMFNDPELLEICKEQYQNSLIDD
jgi:predicted protein tyrosine phosphatase